jgi:hypothetical protein
MDRRTDEPQDVPKAPGAGTDDTDAEEVEGHLYGEYYKPQVQGRWAGRTGRVVPDDSTDSPPRRTRPRKATCPDGKAGVAISVPRRRPLLHSATS